MQARSWIHPPPASRSCSIRRASKIFPSLGAIIATSLNSTPTVQVVPGLRGGLRMGGQQSDYSGLVIDGADATNNYFGEKLRFARNEKPHRASRSCAGIPGGDQRLRAGIRPRYRRLAQRGHEVRHQRNPRRSARILPRRLTHRERRARRAFQHRQPKPVRRFSRLAETRKIASSCSSPPTFSARTGLSTPSSARRDRTSTACEAFLASAGPTVTRRRRVPTFSPLHAAPARVGEGLFPACYGVATAGGLVGPHNQYQNFFTLLGHYDYQFSPANHFSIRGLGSRNHTNGFTGGQGQTETPYSIGTAENFVNQGIGGVFTLTTALGQKVNELRVQVSGETRKRHAIYNDAPAGADQRKRHQLRPALLSSRATTTPASCR